MARSLRLKVVAEGVETAEQMAFLRERGCREMQGYLFGTPREAEAFARLITAPAAWVA
jgi:EAL domain-containing protein (putative c-di-GMP-specific phosphodiesterase class I)